jgi:hypothetical protein
MNGNTVNKDINKGVQLYKKAYKLGYTFALDKLLEHYKTINDWKSYCHYYVHYIEENNNDLAYIQYLQRVIYNNKSINS